MTATAASTHRVTRAVAGMRATCTDLAEVPLWSMDAAETTAAIEDVLAREAQLAELKARLLTHADAIDLPGQTGRRRRRTGWPTTPRPPAPPPTARLGSPLGSRPTSRPVKRSRPVGCTWSRPR
jgi:hypothetical protein